MSKTGEKHSILFGGKAGQGPNILTHLLGESLVKLGYYVFYYRDYQSLIRGGHNFNVLTFSENPIHSNESEIDILVALDDLTKKKHEKELKENGALLEGNFPNMYFAGRIFKLLCIEFSVLEEQLKKLGKRFEENLVEAKKGYEEETKTVCKVKLHREHFYFNSGGSSIAEGAIKSGLDIYYAYPMTPATSVLGDLAEKQVENNYLVLELENEISVVNAAIGSAITGAKSMVGTSGGGFDLMTEGISMAGIAEVPLVVYLAQRPGPASGVPTYTAQADLNIARFSGHGEFPRIVLAPGDPNECEELVSQAFYFSQKYKTPSIILSDKHLAESLYTMTSPAKITPSQKTIQLARFNSYEKDPTTGAATDEPEIIKSNFDKRLKKQEEIKKESKKFKTYKIYGNKNSKNLIVGWGSTKGAILDAISGLDVCFLQILYIDPFPEEVKKILESKNILLIENNSTAQLGQLIAEKTGIFIPKENQILRYDARPFLCDELNVEIKKRIK